VGFFGSALLLSVGMSLVQAGTSAEDLNQTVTYFSTSLPVGLLVHSQWQVLPTQRSVRAPEGQVRAFQEGDKNAEDFSSGVGRQQESRVRPSVPGENQRRQRDRMRHVLSKILDDYRKSQKTRLRERLAVLQRTAPPPRTHS